MSTGAATDLRNPLDVLAAAEGVALGTSSSSRANDISNASMITTGPLADGTTTTEARSGTVSIIVSYRPNLNKGKGGCCGVNSEAPPSYDSLFAGERPPNYSAVSADIEQERMEASGGDAPDAIRVTEEVEVAVEAEARSLCRSREGDSSSDSDEEGASGNNNVHELTASVNVMVHN